MVSVLFPLKKNKGFTLVELLIVLGILGILVTAGFTAYTASQRNARDAKRRTDLETIRQALELHKSESGSYPVSAGWCTVIWGGGNPSSPTYPQVRDALINGGYLLRLPQDPLYANTNKDYAFRRAASGYTLYAEQESTPLDNQSTGDCAYGNATYDYIVTNP